ncbi:MAG: methyltransferase domain-containing protein [Flavobacteriales bacterium]|nr:methyltransferase domain-containing protein [Crocinitomicaceae bacterium]NBX78865.1 methyltransferase domain-containing protein [Flavobacteriales bacterium]
MELDAQFWQSRYENNQTGWDLGSASPPLVHYFNQLEDKNIKILIPGCGNAHEAEYLFNNGFQNVFVIDLAEAPLKNFKSKAPEFPENQLIQGDFFILEDTFDLIIEQTLFCAINPELRNEYIKKTSNLLTENGKFVGLLFDRMFDGGPPFGGSKIEYLEYFKPNFESIYLESCYNSIAPRQGSEVFFIARK